MKKIIIPITLLIASVLLFSFALNKNFNVETIKFRCNVRLGTSTFVEVKSTGNTGAWVRVTNFGSYDQKFGPIASTTYNTPSLNLTTGATYNVSIVDINGTMLHKPGGGTMQWNLVAPDCNPRRQELHMNHDIKPKQ